jgi:hypothetical protein
MNYPPPYGFSPPPPPPIYGYGTSAPQNFYPQAQPAVQQGPTIINLANTGNNSNTTFCQQCQK